MIKLKKIIAVLQIILIIVPLSGCWNYREIESLSIVSGIAIDKGQNGYKYHLTVECLTITGNPDEANTKSTLIETDGDTFFDAALKTLSQSDKRLYYGDCKVVIVSNELADEGIRPLLDWFTRDAELRLTTNFLISKEKTAGEILQQEPSSQKALSFHIIDMLTEAAKYEGYCAQMPLYKINNILNTPGFELVLPGIKIRKNASESSLELATGVIFHDDKRIGWLKEDEYRYFMFVENNVKHGLILTGLNPSENNISLEILQNKTAVKPIMENGTLTMEIDIHTDVAYGEENSEQKILEKNSIETIEKCANRSVKSGVDNVISSMQKQSGSDIFGFGDKIYKDMPNNWDKLKKDWNKTFRTIKYSVNADVKIRNTALTLSKDGE